MADHPVTNVFPNAPGATTEQQSMVLAQTGMIPEFLFEEVPCYLALVGPDLHMIRANRAFRERFGDRTGKHCLAAFRGPEERRSGCPVSETLVDGLAHQSEELWRMDGQDIYVIVKTAPIFDDQGRVAQVIEMSMDVTEMKRLQIQLEKKQQEYKYLFDNVPCYLTVVSPDYDVLQTNRAFDRDFGHRVGEKCYQVYKKRDSKCDHCPVEQTLLDGSTHTSEHVWFLNGQESHIIATTSPVKDDNGEIVAVMEMCTDITEVKRLQSELSLLGETIAGMSHAIKNILSGLQGGVYVVDSGLDRGKDDRVRVGWDMVKRNVEKISELVKGILYASKERLPEKVPADPGELLTEVCDLYETKVSQQGITLTRGFEPHMGQALLDPSGIHTVVSNLVSNAIEACRGAGNPGRTVTVTAHRDNDTLFIRVADNGAGIPEEITERLFTKFYSTKGSKGTGLGLVITRKIVEEHGGSISVESEVGKGTSFLVRIPS
jgi:PAS domain S-box-containing protein